MEMSRLPNILVWLALISRLTLLYIYASSGILHWQAQRIITSCEGDVDEGDRVSTCITLYEIDEGGVRTQLETERHEGMTMLEPFFVVTFTFQVLSLFQYKRVVSSSVLCVCLLICYRK